MSPRFFILFSCPVLLFNWYHLIKRVICWIRMNYFLDKFDTNCDTWLWVVDKRRNSTMASWQFPKIHLQWNFDEKLSVRHLLYFPGREWNCEKEKKTKEFSRWNVIFWRFLQFTLFIPFDVGAGFKLDWSPGFLFAQLDHHKRIVAPYSHHWTMRKIKRQILKTFHFSPLFSCYVPFFPLVTKFLALPTKEKVKLRKIDIPQTSQTFT